MSRYIEIDKKGPPMTQSKLGITPGEWDFRTCGGKVPIVRKVRRHEGEAYCYEATIFNESGFVVTLDFGYGKPTDEAAAKLIAEAGTVANRTGLTPGELVKLIADLVNLNDNGYPESDHAAALWNKARSITSTVPAMSKTPSEAAVRARKAIKNKFAVLQINEGKIWVSPAPDDELDRLIDEAFGTEEVVKALETISKYPGLSAKNVKAIVDEALSKLKGIDDAH